MEGLGTYLSAQQQLLHVAEMHAPVTDVQKASDGAWQSVMPPVVDNDLVKITPVLLTAEAAEVSW